MNILKSKNELSDIDVAFVEGAIASDRDKEKLLKIREVAKHVVAIGSCAVSGLPSSSRNSFPQDIKDEISPYLKQAIHLDGRYRWCKYLCLVLEPDNWHWHKIFYSLLSVEREFLYRY